MHTLLIAGSGTLITNSVKNVTKPVYKMTYAFNQLYNEAPSSTHTDQQQSSQESLVLSWSKDHLAQAQT